MKKLQEGHLVRRLGANSQTKRLCSWRKSTIRWKLRKKDVASKYSSKKKNSTTNKREKHSRKNCAASMTSRTLNNSKNSHDI